jgi:hypothetical protein
MQGILQKGMLFLAVLSGTQYSGMCDWMLSSADAQVVPGTGTKMPQYGDDFEDAKWNFVHNFPKSSKEQDEQLRYPRGYSVNQRWFESPKRGQPDEILRVKAPEGGITGSEWALSIRTKNAGVPGQLSYDQMQDDLIMNGRILPVSYSPNATVRVYLPPFEQWENRSGAHFGVRADCSTTVYEADKDEGRKFLKMFRRTGKTTEPYWPGMFICFNSETDSKNKSDFAYIIIRGDKNGHEVPGPRITHPGWWTLGISATPDGMIHFYASEGVDDLTPADLVTSQFPYGYKAETFTTIFFNSVNKDDGKTWSTNFIIDDPALYYNGRLDRVAEGGTAETTTR